LPSLALSSTTSSGTPAPILQQLNDIARVALTDHEFRRATAKPGGSALDGETRRHPAGPFGCV
jgi:hypothetical protein